MNRFLPLSIFCLALGLQGKMAAQEPAMGQSATAPAASSTNQAPAQLTPPPDTAPPSTVPASSDQTSATAPGANTKPPETPKSTSTPLSPQEIARIQQQEIIRRQELVFQANDHLATARQQELGQNYPEARKNYLFAAEAYGTISRSTTDYAKSADGLTRVDFKLYDDALKFGDTARAKLLIDEVVKYNPNDKEANKRLAEIDHMLANPNDTSLLGNPAVTPALVKKVDEIQQLFAEAEQFRRTGQWDQAEERLKRIEGLDPYNKAAPLQLERIDKAKSDYAEQARLETRDERLRQVEEKWYEPVINKDDLTSPQEGQETLIRATTFNIDQQLRSIFVSLDFSPGTTIEQATTYLSIKSKTLDPQHKGVNFIIQPEASTSAKPISLTLNNVPLGEALRYICQLANVKFKVQDYAISIVPFSQNTDDLISRTFIVQPNFVEPPSAVSTASVAATVFGGGAAGGARPLPPAVAPGGTGDTGTAEADPVRAALEQKGVKFPPGASAVYTSNTGQLTIVNTADQMELIEELVNAGQAPTYMVRISTKFVEINQNDLNDLTFNSAFNFLNPLTGGAVSTTTPLTTPHFNTALPGALAIAPDSIDALIAPPATSSNQLYFRAFLDAAQYNVVINALAQKKSMDVLSEPFTLTKSGEQGVLEAVRVFPYPTAFDPPELETINNTGAGFIVVFTPPSVVATTPTDFKRRNIGVRLVIKPQISADNQTVDLALFPEVTQFDGFINYGSKIFVGNEDGTTSLLSNNVINQPVFDTRRINTKVLIKDGSTVVMGGLIREDLQTINDKVPLLGDLPLVGRLFQSKAVQSTKRNLIIFVTANIYRTDGELLNPPEQVDAADVLTGRASLVPTGTP
jgi:general secretion pathway protein D